MFPNTFLYTGIWMTWNVYLCVSENTISSLPLSSRDSTTSSKMCKSIQPFRRRKVPLAPARGTRGRREENCPTLHHDITHETFTSLCSQDDHASLPLVEAGSAQNWRGGFIGVAAARVIEKRWGGWWGYWIDQSSLSSAHTDEGKGKCCRVSELVFNRSDFRMNTVRLLVELDLTQLQICIIELGWEELDFSSQWIHSSVKHWKT